MLDCATRVETELANIVCIEEREGYQILSYHCKGCIIKLRSLGVSIARS